MSEQQLHLRDVSRSGATANERAPSIVQRIAGSQMTANPAARPRSRVPVLVAVIVLAVGAGAVWMFVARKQLQSSLVHETAQHLGVAQRAFDALRAQTQANLTAHCRLLVEDPRLKATLATEGMDAATVADILQDLAKLRRTGFLLVLAPDGRVFAQAGAAELEGIDLSASSLVKKAREAEDASVGSWVLAGKVMDLSIKSIRYGESVVAYLVVGQPVDQALLAAVAEQTDVSVASAIANKVAMTSSNDPAAAAVFAQAVAQPDPLPHVLEVGGQRYVTRVVDLTETAQAHRLVLASSLEPAAQRFRVLEWMVFVPPGLVLLAVLFVLSAIRSPRRIS
jgi:hypothetical protein